MEDQISRKEFDELIITLSKALVSCAVAMDKAREELITAATIISSFESFYCRKCKKFFKRGQLKITGLFVPCPDCKDGLIPARNLTLPSQEDKR